jgi:plastocyanin
VLNTSLAFSVWGDGPPEAVRSYSYVLKTAGNFTYVCIYHAPSGMAGSIKVA